VVPNEPPADVRLRVLYLAAHQARAIVRRYEDGVSLRDIYENVRRFWSARPPGSRIGIRQICAACYPPEVAPSLAAADSFVSSVLFGEPVPSELRRAALEASVRPPAYGEVLV
jgi:hypothetical protein